MVFPVRCDSVIMIGCDDYGVSERRTEMLRVPWMDGMNSRLNESDFDLTCDQVQLS